MPQHEHLVLCGGLGTAGDQETDTVWLNLHGPSRNVRLQIEDISSRLVEDISDALVDLLEIAAYVYAADSAISRGGPTDLRMGQRWRRRLRFVVPVREPDLWSQNEIASALVDTLSFLSDDDYQFEFELLRERPLMDAYFRFRPEPETSFLPDEVILFSGGLDSFAGTVEELVVRDKRVALVSHRSSKKIVGTQDYLVHQLRDRLRGNRVFHVPVWANLAEGTTRESTHRTRSFLFAALGAVTARLFDLDRITFFENGIVSLNLPPLAQVVGARATRATHPQVLAGFRRLLSEIVGESFDVANPYRWLTKAEVIERISVNGFSDLIRHTRSCAHVHEATRLHPHCGLCSQCIDRRFAILAAGLEQDDPAEAYKVDLLTGERSPGPSRELALAYVRSASDIHSMMAVDFFSHYGEASRAVGFFGEPPDTTAKLIFDLHQRHASAVCRVFDEAISAHRAALRDGSLPSACLLTLVAGQHDRVALYPERIPAIERPFPGSPEIRMAIDEVGRCVILDRWGRIRGVGAEILIALAEPFRKAARDELAPESYPFIKSAELRRRLHCSGNTLRRRVLRCRNDIARLATAVDGTPPPIDAIIENHQWRGYRLNPDSIRIVAITELTRRK